MGKLWRVHRRYEIISFTVRTCKFKKRSLNYSEIVNYLMILHRSTASFLTRQGRLLLGSLSLLTQSFLKTWSCVNSTTMLLQQKYVVQLLCLSSSLFFLIFPYSKYIVYPFEIPWILISFRSTVSTPWQKR